MRKETNHVRAPAGKKAPDNAFGGGLKKLCKKLTSNPNMKRIVIMNIPYTVVFYMVDKEAWLYRHCLGDTLMDKLGVLFQNFSFPFQNPLPSFHPMDLLIGLAGAAAAKGILYLKSKNAKKYRTGQEYGSARWGNSKDIEPYIDQENFENNIPLTQTERLRIRGRAPKPKYERNKNVVVIGGSGSGKTRFYVKPSLMQLTDHVSYVVTDPKGRIVEGQRNNNTSLLSAIVSVCFYFFSLK